MTLKELFIQLPIYLRELALITVPEISSGNQLLNKADNISLPLKRSMHLEQLVNETLISLSPIPIAIPN